RLRELLLTDVEVKPTELETVDREIQGIVADAHQFAEKSPWPDPASATEHVYSSDGALRLGGSLALPVAPSATPFEDSGRATQGSRASHGSGTKEITFMLATLEALTEEMARDPTIFVLGEG